MFCWDDANQHDLNIKLGIHLKHASKSWCEGLGSMMGFLPHMLDTEDVHVDSTEFTNSKRKTVGKETISGH